MIDAIFFDLDGVLFQSLDAHRMGFEETLEPFKILDFKYTAVAGMRTEEAFRKIFADCKTHLDAAQLRDLCQQKREAARRHLTVTKPIDPDAFSVLKDLSSSYRLALASSASPETIDLFLEWSGSRSFFSCILSGKEVDEAKPSPEIYLKTARALDLSTSRCVVVEDSEAGIEAGLRAGAKVVVRQSHFAIAPGYFKHPRFAGEIKALKELPSLLAKL